MKLLSTGEVFAEPCGDSRSSRSLLYARPLMTERQPVFDLRRVGPEWLVLESDRVLVLDGLERTSSVKATVPIRPSNRRDLYPRILSTEPLEVRFEPSRPVSIRTCEGEMLPLETASPEDGRLVLDHAGSEPLLMRGHLVALSAFSEREALVTIQKQDDLYEVWLVAVACVR